MNLTAPSALRNGKYVLDTQLGQGVFGITYRATNTESGQPVVIKTPAENLCQHPEFDRFKQPFLELAKRLSCCKHPNLVRVLDYFSDAERPYLVMEYIPGQTLAELIQANVLPEAKAIKYTHQIGNALSVLHQNRLLHRDVKPQNIIRRQNSDCVVLCEFGITCEFTPGVMQTHANLVSVGYAPPEQHSFGDKRTPATDIYALAATLYCLLTGRSPLPAPVREALHSDGNDRLFLLDLGRSAPNLSPAVKQALWRGLEIAAQKRPQTVQAWLSLLKSQQKTNAKAQPVIAKRCSVSTPALKEPAPSALPSVAKPKVNSVVPPQQNSLQAEVKPTPTKSPTPQPPTPARQDDTGTRGRGDAERDVSQAPRPDASHTRVGVPPQNLPQGARGENSQDYTRSRFAGSRLMGGSSPHQNGVSVSVRDNSTPKPKVTQRAVTKPKPQGEQNGSAAPKSTTKSPTLLARMPLRALLMTGAIAASAGVGFGFALRINSPNEPGSTILHTRQSFPPSRHWPMTDPQLRSPY